MASLDSVRTRLSVLPDVSEEIHFRRIAFRRGKTRFAIFDPARAEFALRLPPGGSGRTRGIERGILVPSPGRYGAEGWCALDLEAAARVDVESLLDEAHAAATVPARKAPSPAAAARATKTGR